MLEYGQKRQSLWTGYLAAAAEQIGSSLTVRLFDGDIAEGTSRGMDSPFYGKEPALV